MPRKWQKGERTEDLVTFVDKVVGRGVIGKGLNPRTSVPR